MVANLLFKSCLLGCRSICCQCFESIAGSSFVACWWNTLLSNVWNCVPRTKGRFYFRSLNIESKKPNMPSFSASLYNEKLAYSDLVIDFRFCALIPWDSWIRGFLKISKNFEIFWKISEKYEIFWNLCQKGDILVPPKICVKKA